MNPDNENATPSPLPDTVTPGEVRYLLPVSFQQERLLLLEQRFPGDPAWNATVSFRIAGSLDIDVLNRALNTLFARHETLRTCFVQRNGDWLQVIDPPAPYQLPIIDLLDLPESQRQAEADRISTVEARFHPQLDQGSLFRFKLLRLADREFQLLTVFHQAIADLWSMGILTRELSVLYAAYSRGQASPMAEVSLQYGDYCVWERENAAISHFPAESAFWKAQLHDLPSLDLPVDTPNPSPSSAARILSRLLPVELTAKAEQLAASEGTTVFNFMFAVLSVLLHRYSGQTAFGIGTQVAGRPGEELEGVVGPFVNTILLRPDLSGNPTFRQFLARVHDMASSAMSNAMLRWEHVIREARPQDYPLQDTIFRVNFICQRSVRPVEFAGISLASTPATSTGALYDLNLFLIERSEGWRMSCEFRTDLFKDQTITTLLENYDVVLRQLVQRPEMPIGDLPQFGPQANVAELKTPLQSEDLPPHALFVFPVSSSQERIWFSEQLLSGNTGLNLPIPFRIRGSLSIGVMKRTFDEIISRHESLRTTFRVIGDKVCQIVHAPAPASLTVITMDGVPAADREAQARERMRQEVRKPVDLTRGPLFRAVVIRLTRDDSFLLMILHHIVGDGWSLGVVTKEFERVYNAFASNLPSPVPEPPLQYADFVAWQRSWYQTAEYRTKLAYWIQQLDQLPPALLLPADFAYRPDRGSSGAVELLYLPADVTESVRNYCAREGVTMFMFTLAAFYVLLYRYSGSSDLIVGTPTANRNQPDLESTIGFFADTLALRIRFKAQQQFPELLCAVRDVTTSAYENQQVPFDEIVRAVKADRSTGRHPIYQVLFSYQKAFIHTPQLTGLHVNHEFVDRSGSLIELWLALIDRPEGLRLTVEYSTELFRRETILRVCSHYQEILASLARNPDQPVSTIPMLSVAERSLILDEWNATNRPYPAVCVHQLFEEQAQLTPDAVALTFGSISLTYRELNERADRLAAALRASNAGPGRLVALCVERSFNMVVGVLGILKSGAAYVPIDPAYPADRIAFVLQDCAAEVLVTEGTLLDSLPPTGARPLFLDEIDTQPGIPTVPAAQPQSSDLAYVIYTSGSTGKPKGVQIPHRAVVNFLNSMRREPGLAPSDVLLAVTTLSFDIAGLELYLPLITGASLVIATREQAADGEALLTAIRRHGITVLQATPATFRLMMNAGWTVTPGLKALCGGEAMPPDLAAQLIPRCAELWNMYGPTETTIWSTCARVTSASDIHIGRPIDNTTAYILDENSQPQPVGIPGELLIGGDGLAVGYLGRSELTAERFVPHPFLPGERLYRTGDLARYRPDGNIDYLGRLDFQVKIRGHRIELGEIEAQIATFPGIAQNAVAVREDTPGESRLVGYLVCPNGAPSIESMRDHLRSSLPDYMIPSAFVILSGLPLTPNGKVDRGSLPAPGAITTLALEKAVPPRNPVEQRLAEIFADVLGRPVTSVTASFFDMGGHSLMAARLMSRIDREFGHHLPLALLFDSPSVAAIASRLHVAPTKAAWSSLVPIRPQQGKPNFYLVHGAGGNVLLYSHLARELAPDVSLYGFQSQGLDHKTSPLETVEEMALHYVRELRAFQPVGPYHIGGYCMGGSVAYEMARLLLEQGQIVGLVAMLDSYNLATVKHTRTKGSTISLVRQKVSFHIGNLSRLNAREAVSYVSEKSRIAAEHAGINLFSRETGTKRASDEDINRRIQDINHDAGWNFVPKPAPVRLTVFRTHKNYDFFPDHNLGWQSVVGNEIELVELPANPHAMLVHPIVAVLASEIRKRLAKGDSAIPSTSISRASG